MKPRRPTPTPSVGRTPPNARVPVLTRMDEGRWPRPAPRRPSSSARVGHLPAPAACVSSPPGRPPAGPRAFGPFSLLWLNLSPHWTPGPRLSTRPLLSRPAVVLGAPPGPSLSRRVGRPRSRRGVLSVRPGPRGARALGAALGRRGSSGGSTTSPSTWRTPSTGSARRTLPLTVGEGRGENGAVLNSPAFSQPPLPPPPPTPVDPSVGDSPV